MQGSKYVSTCLRKSAVLLSFGRVFGKPQPFRTPLSYLTLPLVETQSYICVSSPHGISWEQRKLAKALQTEQSRSLPCLFPIMHLCDRLAWITHVCGARLLYSWWLSVLLCNICSMKSVLNFLILSCMVVLRCAYFRQLLLDEDIPCSHGIDSVHFFPHGSQRGREEQLKVSTQYSGHYVCGGFQF